MAMHQNTWTPDTCDNPGCRIVIEFDDALPQDQIVHNLVRVDRRCASHAAMTDAQVWNEVRRENYHRNKINALVQSLRPDLTEQVNLKPERRLLLQSGQITRDDFLAQGFDQDQFERRFVEPVRVKADVAPGTRRIRVRVLGAALTDPEKQTLQAGLRQALNTLKVDVV